METIKISILFGEREVGEYEENQKLDNVKDNLFNYDFETDKERIAFLKGINEAIGWQGFLVINNP